jgi:hypothetical protein
MSLVFPSTRPHSLLLLAWLVGSVAGCTPDVVAFGYYGAPEDAGDDPSPTRTATTGQPMAVASTPGPANVDDAQASVHEASASQVLEASSTKATACDLTGRWLATEREVANGLGAQEATHTWYYLEITQTGSQATVTKGLDCGGDIRGISAVGADSDYPQLWPALLTHDAMTGRKATSIAMSSGCSVSFDRRYLVMGATVPFYEDPSQMLPTISQQASGSTPGWEDWDNDGNPGYTVNVTGFVTGQVYLATRTWSVWSGTVPTGASTFKLANSWNSEQSLLGYNGSQLLTAATSATPDNDASLHFVLFARLGASQATGDDPTTCAAVRGLVSMLTPGASN